MKYLNALDCQKLLENNKEIQCIDVRESYEFLHGNCGFLNIPMGIVSKNIHQLNPSLPIVIICKSGKRAEAVGNLLETEHGFLDIVIVENGITGWKSLIDATIEID